MTAPASGGAGLPSNGAPPPAAGGHGAPHAPAPTHGTAGHWINQGGQWKLIHAVGPGQWVQGPKPGFNAPPKPKPQGAAGAAATRAGSYNPLQPLSMQQISQQATRTVQSAYKPVLTELNMQGGQEQAILDKQAADNQVYQQWLNSKSLSVQAMEDQVNQSTNTLEQQLVGATNAQTGAEAANLTAAANATPGNPGNSAPAFQPGTPLGNELSASVSASQQVAAGGAERALNDERVATAQEGSSALNAQAAFGAGTVKEQSAGQEAMQKIAIERAGNVAKESSDIQREIARLEGVNINVAENNRNYAAAAEKLGLSAAETQSLIQNRAAQTKIAAANAVTSATRAAQSAQNDSFNQWIKGQQLTLDQKKFAQTIINDNAQNALRAAETYKAQHGGTLTPAEQNTQYGILDGISSTLKNLQSTYGLSAQQAYHAVANGGFEGKGTNSKGKTVPKWISVPRAKNVSYLNAAYNLLPGGAGLTQGDVAYLKQLGLADPLGHYHQVNATGGSTPPIYGASNPGTRT